MQMDEKTLYQLILEESKERGLATPKLKLNASHHYSNPKRFIRHEMGLNIQGAQGNLKYEGFCIEHKMSYDELESALKTLMKNPKAKVGRTKYFLDSSEKIECEIYRDVKIVFSKRNLCSKSSLKVFNLIKGKVEQWYYTTPDILPINSDAIDKLELGTESKVLLKKIHEKGISNKMRIQGLYELLENADR